MLVRGQAAAPRRAEPDELLVGTRSRRKALGADMQRLEQVRLARAVRAGDEDDARLECELEPGVVRTLAGFENHAGRTYLDPGAEPLGRVVQTRAHRLG